MQPFLRVPRKWYSVRESESDKKGKPVANSFPGARTDRPQKDGLDHSLWYFLPIFGDIYPHDGTISLLSDKSRTITPVQIKLVEKLVHTGISGMNQKPYSQWYDATGIPPREFTSVHTALPETTKIFILDQMSH